MTIGAKKNLHGVITALGTPLDEDLGLHQEGMRRQVNAQIRAGVNGLLCLGTMGMAQMHTPEVREAAVRVTIEETRGRIPVLVGCGDCSIERTRAYISAAEKYRPDGIVLITPYFPKLNEGELFDYFVSLARSTPIPVYLYDIPFYTNCPLSAGLIKRLAAEAKIAGLKASGDLATMRECIEHFRDDPGFAIFSGHSPFLDLAVLMGADGIIDGLFALAPEAGIAIYQAAARRDVDAALAAERRLMQIRDVVLIESVFASFTHAMNLLGFPGNFGPPPMRNLSAQGKEKVNVVMAELGLI